MNTLHTFGCSFTAPYTFNGAIGYKQYYQYKNNNYPPVWADLLSDKLNMSLNNYGVGGSSNYEIFSTFCKNVDKIKTNDIVMIGWSFKERFRLVDESINNFVRVLPLVKPKLNNVSSQTMDEILVNRGNHIWINEVMNWEKFIRKYLDSIGVDLITWSFDKSFPNEIYIFDELIKLGGETIIMETNGEINDIHMGENGHIVQSEYFYNIIKNQPKKTKLI
jgi:hypothetical protein